MPLMDRIYCKSFLDMSFENQKSLIERIRTIRSSALNAAKVSSKRITKSAMKNIAKRAGTKQGKKMLKDPTKAAKAALAKLTPAQIMAITKQLQGL